jgi:hypothetical protein
MTMNEFFKKIRKSLALVKVIRETNQKLDRPESMLYVAVADAILAQMPTMQEIEENESFTKS